MILTVDVGNTQTQLGLFDRDSDKPKNTWIVKTVKDMTVDTLYVALSVMKEAENLDFNDVDVIAILCVVPSLVQVWKDCVAKISINHNKIIDFKILNWESAKKLGSKFYDCKYAFPHEVGPDIIAASIATKTMFSYPSVSIDFGTATNFNVINSKGEFLGGLISPGLAASLKAMLNDTSMLPEIEIKKPSSVIGYDTIESIQSGIVYGEAAKADGIIGKISQKLNSKLKVITTGGWSKLLTDCMEVEAVFCPDLILQGLKIFTDNIDNS